MTALNVQTWAEQLRKQVGQVVVGKQNSVDLLLTALLCEGHVLLEDVPGVGKTTLIRALAQSLDCQFRRVQFTPDLLPSDVTGLNFYNQKLSEFQFRAGPLFANIVLADEINRATPRTQSALLEAMAEATITIDGETHQLTRPFLVLATQNPIELEGTFPLPEAQLDRFLLRVNLGYPSETEEHAIIQRFNQGDPWVAMHAVSNQAQLLDAIHAVRSVHLSDAVRQYAIAIVRTTREHSEIELGASPRGSLALTRAAQAWALIHGRDFVLPDDVKQLVPSVLAHRLILGAEARLAQRSPEKILADIVKSIATPVEERA
ncbi:AAA family ATPase [Herpetosiphon llansteffanensis]